MKLLALLITMIQASTTIEPIYWRVDNSRFPDVRHVHFEEKMDIFCPDMRDGDSSSTSHHYQKIYMVDKESYESCQLTSKATYITACNAPKREKKFTIKFQQVNPMPFGLEFSEGTYYLISTSGGTDMNMIDQTLGGVCQSHNMRVQLEVSQGAERGPEVMNQNPDDASQPTVHRTTEVNKPTEYTIRTVLPDVTPEHYTQTVSTAIIVGIVFLVFIMFLVVIAFILFRRTSLKSKSSAFNPSTMSDYTIGKGGSFQDSYQEGIHHYAPAVAHIPITNNQQIPYINNPADYGQKIVTLYPNHQTRTNQTLNQSQLANDFTYRIPQQSQQNHQNTTGSYTERLSERTDQTVLV